MPQITTDVVGLGWREELAAEIGANIDGPHDIECLEVIAEDYFRATAAQQEGLASLARLLPLSLHGVSLGMASTLPLRTSIADQWRGCMGRFNRRSGPNTFPSSVAADTRSATLPRHRGRRRPYRRRWRTHASRAGSWDARRRWKT